MATKQIVRNAYANLAADILEAVKNANTDRTRGIAGIEGFVTEYDKTVAKLRNKGRIGSKRWGKLVAAMPAQVRQYFSMFRAEGYDFEDDTDFLAFMQAVQALAKNLSAQAQLSALTNFATLVADVFNEPDDEDEDEDED